MIDPEKYRLAAMRSEWPALNEKNLPKDYFELIETTGCTIIDRESDDGYEGESHAIVQRGTRFGWLTFGWGSCSGCDDFEAAEGNAAGMAALREVLFGAIVWRDSLADVIVYATDPEAIRHWSGSGSAARLIDRIKGSAR